MSANKTVLIAEDDIFLIKAYEAQLAKESLNLLVAKNGEEALRLLQETVPDLIILDIVMPKKSGIEVLRSMRKDSRLQNVPVLIATNLGNVRDRQECEKLGISAYIIKSDVSINQVSEQISALLARSS